MHFCYHIHTHIATYAIHTLSTLPLSCSILAFVCVFVDVSVCTHPYAVQFVAQTLQKMQTFAEPATKKA